MFELQYLVMRAQSKASKTRSGMISQPFPCFFTGMRLSFLREKAVSHIKKARCGMKLNMIEHHCHCGKCGVFTMCFHHVFSIQTWAWTSLNHLWKNSHQGGPCTDYMIRTSNGTHKIMGDLAKQKGGCGQQSCYVQLDWFVVLVQLYKNYSALDIIQEKGMIVAPSRIERSNQCPFFCLLNTQTWPPNDQPWFWPRQVNKKKYTVLLAWFRSRRGEVHLFWPFLEAGLRIWNYPCGSWKKWPIATLCWPKLGNPLVSQ